jgi:hypothetical protein
MDTLIWTCWQIDGVIVHPLHFLIVCTLTFSRDENTCSAGAACLADVLEIEGKSAHRKPFQSGSPELLIILVEYGVAV